MARKYGKLPAVLDKRTLQMGRYTLATPPPYVQWNRGFNIDWGMMLNGPNNGSTGAPTDGLGDCVEAAKGHAVQTWTLDNGRLVTPPDSVVLSNYEQNGGYVLGDPNTDNGEDELSSLKAWRKGDFGGHKLSGFVDPAPGNTVHVAQSIWLFAGLFTGIQVPESFEDQVDSGQIIDVVPNDSLTGEGHALWLDGHDFISKVPTFSFKTWGMLRKMTVRFFLEYTDEAHCLLSPDWINSHGISPSQFDFATLNADLAQVTA